MKVDPSAPKRPALRYYGGKFRLAPWIISFFPEHINYVEPCGGAASVLLRKPISPLETYNDLESNIVNFLRVLRDRPDELIEKIGLTPWSREEYLESKRSIDGLESVEKARRFLTRINQARVGEGSGWRFEKTSVYKDGGVRQSKGPRQMQNSCQDLQAVAKRLMRVQIENRDAREIIADFDNEYTLTYFDPPYPKSIRVSVKDYKLETDEQFHIECAELLRECKGFVVVSGFACQLYTELYESHGWERHDKEAQINSGGKRIESVWLSPRTVEALNRPKQTEMF